ncbi:hypothetical protein HanIR_Chr10g0454981 [Helianthus annuus]|nr:hypothetical protein HanIR_Chr10g0454981 [Helianthus annuus]
MAIRSDCHPIGLSPYRMTTRLDGHSIGLPSDPCTLIPFTHSHPINRPVTSPFAVM